MFCNKCGIKIQDKSEFCFQCGARLNLGSNANTPNPDGPAKPGLRPIDSDLAGIIHKNLQELCGYLFAVRSTKITGSFHDIDQYLHCVNEIGFDHIQNIIKHFDFNSIRINYELNTEKLPELFLLVYRQGLDLFYKMYKEDRVKNFYYNFDQEQIEKNKLIQVLRQNYNIISLELGNLQAMHGKLNSLLFRIKQFIQPNDSGELAKKIRIAGSGLMTFINPFLGVPGVLSQLLGEKQKNQEIQSQFEEFFETLKNFLEKYREVCQLTEKTHKRQMNSFYQKLNESMIPKWLHALALIQSSGHSLNNLPQPINDYFSGLRHEFESS